MMNLIFKRSIYYALSLLPAGVFAQVILPGTYDYDRFIYDQLKSDSTSAITYQSSIFYGNSEGFTLINPLTQTSFNSAYPRSYNDGPVWKSKGLTQEVHSGVQFKKGVIHFTFHPVAYFSQNSSYRLASVNPDQNPLNYQFGVSRNVDFVQRYGTSSFVKFHPGQSEIAVRFKHFQFAASTQNFTLGPAIKNHIIMGNSASGFPHLTIGTPGKVDLRFKGVSLGAIEANLFYGLLSESNHFDTLSNNNRRYLNGMSLGYEVPYIKGLTVGFQRTLYKDTRYFESADLFSMFYIKDNGNVGDTIFTGNDTFDQLASAFINWKLADKDLRLYFEFARNDFNGSLRRVITEFEHSRAYTLGFEKIFTLNKRDLYLNYEHTFLPRYQSYLYRPTPPFYTHHIATQGYTHDGQILGAGTGPGSVSDFMSLLWLNGDNQTKLSFQRIRFDEDYFIAKVPNNLDKIDRHDVEYTIGLEAVRKRKHFIYGIGGDFSYRFNMYFEKENDQFNFNGKIFARYLIHQ